MRRLVAVLALGSIGGVVECSKHEQTEVQHGADLYGRMCAVCHGASGEGYKADNATMLSHPDFLASVSDEFLERAIDGGRSGTVMSAWGSARGGPLPPSDVKAIIAFLRTWQPAQKAVLDERPLSGDASRGSTIYGSQCARCHGPNGTSGPNVRVGNPDLLGAASNGFLRYAIRNGRLGTPMPSFGVAIGDRGVEDVVALLRSWEHPLPATAMRTPELAAPPSPPAPLELGPVPLNPGGPEPVGFGAFPDGKTGVDAVKAQLDRGAKLAILDARAPTDYTLEHIAGAVSVPFYDPDPYAAKLPRDAWLVCYCSCPSAESGQLCQKLHDKGFRKLTVLEEGLGVWKARKYPTHTGPRP